MKFLCTSFILASLTGLTLATLQRMDERIPVAILDSDYYDNSNAPADKVELGRLLFFDKVLSGNRNISCATCHHPDLASGDGVALSLGEGALGLGPDRRAGDGLDTGVHARMPRNSPALFNVGAKEYTTFFHDGRVEVDEAGHYDGGVITPAKWKLPDGLENVLAAQAMFPVTSHTEMAGQQGENPIADAVSANNAAGPGGVWELLADRLRENDEYVERFAAAFPDRVSGPDDITFVLAANAIASFEAQAFRSDNSPFDNYLRTGTPMNASATRGMDLFYAKANCASCHSGSFQTDHDFYAIAMPQIGPGKSDGWNSEYWQTTGVRAFTEDFGRGRVTVRPEDNYKFRTPSLRNVELTGPWGHSGAYDSLEAVVRHHLDPVGSLEAYRFDESDLPPLDGAIETTASGSSLRHAWMNQRRFDALLMRDGWVQQTSALRNEIGAANELEQVRLSDAEVADLIAFLKTLTDPTARDLGSLVPEYVPSGLRVED